MSAILKAIGTPIGLFYKSLTGAPASKTTAQLLVGAKGAAPAATLPQQSAYQKIASGVYGIKDAASGRIVTTGVKVGVGAGLAGVGLAGLGFGVEKAASSLNPFGDKDNGFNIGTFMVVGIIILVLILLLRRK